MGNDNGGGYVENGKGPFERDMDYIPDRITRSPSQG